MATTITNEAEATYEFSGSSEILSVESNENSIVLQDSTGLFISKSASPTEFVAGDIITYTVTITNNSSSYLNGVRIIDNLGGGNLAYVTGSGRLSTSSQSYSVSPISTNPLTFTLQQLAVGATMTLTYRAQVIFNLPATVTSITNNVNGIGYTSTGTITGADSVTIQKKNSVSLTLTKSASVETVLPNTSFNYYLTLSNNNSVIATLDSLVDQLPSNFVLTGATYRIGNGSVITLNATDYTLSSGNLFTLPSSSGPVITVPANGTTEVTLTGYFN